MSIANNGDLMHEQPNPYQPPTGSPSATPARPSRERLGRALLCLMPLASYAYVLAFWSLASVSQARWLQPGVDDPKEIFFGIPLAVHHILQTMAFAILPIMLLMARFSRFPVSKYAVFYFIVFAIAVVLFRLDLNQTTSWIAD